jgi:hypothetical protein
MKEFCPTCGRAKTSWGWLMMYLIGVGTGALLLWILR